MRILLVSQMYPGPTAPDLGTFVAQVERALLDRGHDVDRAVLDSRAGGNMFYLPIEKLLEKGALREAEQGTEAPANGAPKEQDSVTVEARGRGER